VQLPFLLVIPKGDLLLSVLIILTTTVGVPHPSQSYSDGWDCNPLPSQPLQLSLSLLLLVILSEAKNPAFPKRSEATRLKISPKKTAKSTAPKNHPSTNHLHQTIHHTLSTKKPRLPPIFLKNPSKKPPQKNRKQNRAPTQIPPQKIHHLRVYTSKDMSTSTISVDEFQALEQKVLRAVEIIKQEREARAKAEAEASSLREQLEFQTLLATEAQTTVTTLTKERDGVRQRVEKMLQQMDDLL
jgi:hypothetical protein